VTRAEEDEGGEEEEKRYMFCVLVRAHYILSQYIVDKGLAVWGARCAERILVGHISVKSAERS
jgi:hypothetical protein